MPGYVADRMEEPAATTEDSTSAGQKANHIMEPERRLSRGAAEPGLARATGRRALRLLGGFCSTDAGPANSIQGFHPAHAGASNGPLGLRRDPSFSICHSEFQRDPGFECRI